MLRHLTLLLILTAGSILPAVSQDKDSNKNLDIRSSVGDLHVGADADAKKVGLPLYPGAQLKTEGEDHDQANFAVATEEFGMKLIVANYVSNDAPAKILDFYRDKLKKYGKVLECHSNNHGGDVSMNDDNKDSAQGKPLKCDDNSGPVTELKVGTEDNQRIVAVEPGKTGTGSSFALVYVHTRGKRADI